MEICFQLGLDWQEIAELPSEILPKEDEQDVNNCQDIDALVERVRKQRGDKIQAQCATVQLLDIAQPIGLEDIYVSVDILNNITSQAWLDIFELQGEVSEKFNRFDSNLIGHERVPAMQAVATYPKLMVLGKPGSGKTTFLQHIATQCNQGKLQPERIPLFIKLNNFAEDATETGNFNLLNYISQELAYGITSEQIQTILAHGRVLFLLDGLDEIPEDNCAEIVKKIRKLSSEYYKNQFIITCRIGTQQYQFEGFTEIEIADFDSCQIEAFVHKWFADLLVLMKQHIDGIVAFDEQLQQFLIWLNQKSLSVKSPYKAAAIRAFYLTLVLPRDLNLSRDLALCLAIDPRLAGNLATDFTVDLALNRALSLSEANCDPMERILALSFALTYDADVVCDCDFQRLLQQLKKQLPTLERGKEKLNKWWNTNGKIWVEKLRSLLLRCRNIGHQWQFNDKQKELLLQYYTANQLLVDCLKSGCEVTPSVRSHIEETLLLPITRISEPVKCIESHMGCCV
ncbi:NACHT domain-containing protein [Iningainema tapete]|uniref:NACHT domain-containing protein n=1 Tax=Iningainema tapete TaxID=2806730 RepID=UPI00192E00A4|nr:NACHT domain-containing protein [Iningainema tapete]